jgi:hypothetical protein
MVSPQSLSAVGNRVNSGVPADVDSLKNQLLFESPDPGEELAWNLPTFKIA